MAERKIIAVVGATGAQGGGLVRAILNDPSGGFAVRAITRDVHAEGAKALAALGAEVVAADLDNPASLTQAFAGAYGAYCVTFYWTHFSPAKELAHAKAMAEAARQAGIQHAIWSTLEDTRRWVPLNSTRMPTLMGTYKVPHFDAKGEADHFFIDADVPTTFLLASFYWENLISGLAPQRGDDGRLAITLPMGNKKLAGIGAEDIGKCAYGIFKQGHAYIGERIGIASDHLTGVEIAAALTRALGQEVGYNPRCRPGRTRGTAETVRLCASSATMPLCQQHPPEPPLARLSPCCNLVPVQWRPRYWWRRRPSAFDPDEQAVSLACTGLASGRSVSPWRCSHDTVSSPFESTAS
jgi:uncharacterized protein YbjT (DUF2867 family)